MTIRVSKRADGKGWEVDIRGLRANGRKISRIRKFSPYPTKKESEQWAQEIAAQAVGRAAQGAKTTGRAATMGGYFRDYLAVRRLKSPATTVHSYEQRWATWLAEPLGDVSLSAVNRADLVRQVVTPMQAKGLGLGYQRQVLSVVRVLLKDARKQGYDAAPPDVVPELGNPTQEIGADGRAKRLGADAVAKLEEAAVRMGGAYERMWLLLHRFGLRIGEVAALRVDDLRDKSIIVCRHETNQGQMVAGRKHSRGATTEIPARPEVIARLRRLLDEGRRPHRDRVVGYVYQSLPSMWSRLVIAAFGSRDALVNGSGINVHRCRHEYCSALCDAGIPVHLVRAWAGHRSLDTTLVYLSQDEGVDYSAMLRGI
jgi:integrase